MPDHRPLSPVPTSPDAPPSESPDAPPSDAPPATAKEGNLSAAPPPTPRHEAVADPGTNGVSTADARSPRQLLTSRATTVRVPTGTPLSPARLTWRQLRKNRFAVVGGWTLILLYLMAIFAQFIAPYDPQDQSPGGMPNTSFHPPMRLRWREANGTWHKRPFVYLTSAQRNEYQQLVYLPDPNQPRVIEFFVAGPTYHFLGFIPLRYHLFGVEQGSAVFLLGTDEVGRDYFSRMLYGSMISLSVGLVAITITFTLGMLVGGISGFYGGRTDDIIMRVTEVLMSVPDFYLLLALAAALPADLNPIVVYVLIIVILSFVGWAGMARIIRGMVLSVREREYVEAARALGVSDLRIIVRHVLPSTITYAIVAATMSVPGYILSEAGLSFLGLGIRDPMASWGNMLSAAQNLSTLHERPWILAPGFMIFITTLAFNFLGDGLRDALDPKSRR